MTLPLQAGANLPCEQWSWLRLRAIFDHCKWDPQCGDHAVLGRFPLLLEAQTANRLADLAERLTREALAAEIEILGKPELLSELAIPSRIRKCFRKADPDGSRKDIRVMRFDFHYTTGGWQISEVNADVPGGYIEASGWNGLFANQVEGFRAPPNPTKAYASAICDSAPRDSLIALAHATVYKIDRSWSI